MYVYSEVTRAVSVTDQVIHPTLGAYPFATQQLVTQYTAVTQLNLEQHKTNGH